MEAVAETMRAGTYELDSITFDAGLVNSAAIQAALKRCDLFCLFLSRSSVRSSYVDFEVLLGTEFLARGSISRFIAICLDDEAFTLASDNIKFYNIVRKSLTPEASARLIMGQLVSASNKLEHFTHPFVGRTDELKNLEAQASDYQRPPLKCLYISGNSGTGRRSLAAKFYENHFTHVGRIFPEVHISKYDGAYELYFNILRELRPTISVSDLRTRMTSISISSADQIMTIAAHLLNSLLPSNEAAFLIDEGGVLTQAGALTPEMTMLIKHLEARPHPPATFISPRMVPKRYRTQFPDVAFLPITAMEWSDAFRLTSTLLKRKSVEIDENSLNQIISLTDGHPFNIYRIVEDIHEVGVKAFLANPSNYIEWKHLQTSEYIEKIDLSDVDCFVLTILKNIPVLDFDTISAALKTAPDVLSDCLQKLTLLHVVDSEGDRFRLSPALRTAIERDARIKMPPDLQVQATSVVAHSLSLRIEDGTAPVSLVDSAVLASVESGEALTELAAAFLLPSHYVWLAKLRYDQRDWLESIRFGLEALKGEARLSTNGLISACRSVCLAAARTGNDPVFTRAIAKLQARSKDHWIRSNVKYLQGFQLRMRGLIPAAHDLFQEAYDLYEGNISAIRELAAIALYRGDLEQAETLARKAYGFSQNNVYMIDMLLTILIRKSNSKTMSNEMSDLFSKLERVGEENGRSFYTTRRAEFEHLRGDNNAAASLISIAASKTPTIFEVRRLQAEIFLKAGNKNKAYEALQAMDKMVHGNSISEGRSNYRFFLETKAHYLTDIGQFSEAKDLFEDTSYFSKAERDREIKNIEVAQSFYDMRRRP
ncbi:tetratricopeptide (TPR) repeat protein [Xanthobacter flavus]|nr:tetratricopeptide (TPR) repeat protein [Xanthobacter flavus]